MATPTSQPPSRDASASRGGAETAVIDQDAPVIVFENVDLAFDEKVILKNLSFTIRQGHTKIFLGASGAGKSTILKLILGLLKPDRGAIWVKGQRVDQLSEVEMMKIRHDLGMVFQEGALFDSLTVRENVGYKLYEETDQPLEQVHARVEEVLGFVGLSEHIDKAPSALSGGQRRRVAIARAMTAKPPILLYDEPTTGLDPITSVTIDAEIVKLRDLEGVSTIMVTHQLRDAFYVAEHTAIRENGEVKLVPADPEKITETEFIMLRDGEIAFEGDVHELRASSDPYLKSFLS
jgi:phospholipid/cholesterol/gamma-HCH transport system ATP-binding protein